MERRKFFKNSCACGMIFLVSASQFFGIAGTPQEETKKNIPLRMNAEQVKKMLKYVDSTQSRTVKKNIFGQLGYECFYSNNLDKWIEPYIGNVQAFLDNINIAKKSKYWEKLEFDAEHTQLILTGRVVTGCACAFAEIDNPPLSLCHYCCKSFQEQIFSKLLGKKVNVEVTTGFLLGNDRCNTIIHV